MPQISIITPYRNSAGFLPSLVRNLQQQTFQDWECLLVDDGSEDRGAERLARCCAGDARLRLLPLPQPAADTQRLPARPRNHALSQAHSPLLAFLDSDDLWHPRKLELQLAFHRAGDLDLSVTAYGRFRGVDQALMAVRCPPSRLSLARMRRSNPIPLLTAMVRAELLGGGFPPVPHEDYLLWLDLRRDRPDLRYGMLPLVLAFYRLHAGNQTRHRSRVVGWTYRVFRRHGMDPLAAATHLLGWGSCHLRQSLHERLLGARRAPDGTVEELLQLPPQPATPPGPA